MNNEEQVVLFMETMDLTALRIFKTVAEQGGITKAAAKLHRVQSNVTTRVKQLEAQLGTQLFLRHKRRLVLSSEGKVLLAYADRLLRLSSEAEDALRSGGPRGALRVGALESTAAARLPPLLSRYHLAYPDVRLELATGTTGALIARVLSGELDAAFAAEPFAPDGLETCPAFSEELVLITPRSLAKVKAPKDIGNRTVLAFGTGCSYRRLLETWLGRYDVVPERVMEFASYHAIVACTAAGSGVAVVPRSVLHAMRAEREVTIHELPRSASKTRTLLVWRAGYQSSPLDAMRAVLSSVRRSEK